MNKTTSDFLRGAALEALNAKEDVAALEILSLMTGFSTQTPASAQVTALPAGRELIPGEAHDAFFWSQFIRERFIPFISGNGRSRFTSPECLKWIAFSSEVTMTVGDFETSKKGPLVWRNNASRGLQNLKRQGVLSGRDGSKEYEILASALPKGQELRMLPMPQKREPTPCSLFSC